MKLILIGLCCVGFVAAYGKEQSIRVSGKIQCCYQREMPINGSSTYCLPPYRAEIKLFDHSQILPDKKLRTINTGKGDGEYLIEWKGEKIFTVDPKITASGECGDSKTFERDYGWPDNNETDIKQDIVINKEF